MDVCTGQIVEVFGIKTWKGNRNSSVIGKMTHFWSMHLANVLINVQ